MALITPFVFWTIVFAAIISIYIYKKRDKIRDIVRLEGSSSLIEKNKKNNNVGNDINGGNRLIKKKKTN